MAMNWQQLLSAQRFKQIGDEVVPTKTPSTDEGVDALRTDFHIDYDRVVFSGGFRRLGRKTQVHPFAENDLLTTALPTVWKWRVWGAASAIASGQCSKAMAFCLPITAPKT